MVPVGCILPTVSSARSQKWWTKRGRGNVVWFIKQFERNLEFRQREWGCDCTCHALARAAATVRDATGNVQRLLQLSAILQCSCQQYVFLKQFLTPHNLYGHNNILYVCAGCFTMAFKHWFLVEFSPSMKGWLQMEHLSCVRYFLIFGWIRRLNAWMISWCSGPTTSLRRRCVCMGSILSVCLISVCHISVSFAPPPQQSEDVSSLNVVKWVLLGCSLKTLTRVLNSHVSWYFLCELFDHSWTRVLPPAPSIFHNYLRETTGRYGSLDLLDLTVRMSCYPKAAQCGAHFPDL